MSRRRLLTPLLLALALAGGCARNEGQPFGSELDDANYTQGQQLERQNRNSEALAAYLKVIAKRGENAPESHLAVGIINLRDLKEPIAAIYYFQKYLELQPHSRKAPLVRQQIEAAKRTFASTLPGNPMENAADRLEALEKIDRLQRENDQLRAEVAALQAAGLQPAVRPRADSTIPRITVGPGLESSPPVNRAIVGETGNPAGNPPKIGPRATNTPATPTVVSRDRIHVVQPQETRFSIARKYYGNTGVAAKADQIYEANRDLLKSKDDPLRPGMQLRIP